MSLPDGKLSLEKGGYVSVVSRRTTGLSGLHKSGFYHTLANPPVCSVHVSSQAWRHRQGDVDERRKNRGRRRMDRWRRRLDQRSPEEQMGAPRGVPASAASGRLERRRVANLVHSSACKDWTTLRIQVLCSNLSRKFPYLSLTLTRSAS